MELQRGQVLAANKAEYPDLYERMRFVSEPEAGAAMERRAQLLAALAPNATTCCQGSKLHTGPLAPGCVTCTAGRWSCLFINGICNGRCFYCPTSQSSKSEPMTNSLRFPVVQDYIDYLRSFEFQGASISGGEPLMTFDRTLQFVRRIKARLGSAIHLWLYTNGILADEEKIGLLQDAGLDEIRFDLSAVAYRFDKVRLAAGRIPAVTIEIPAIPEDYELLRNLLPQLAEAGVQYLNLHQLRVTPYNAAHLLDRGYTLLHGPKVTVLESELRSEERRVGKECRSRWSPYH